MPLKTSQDDEMPAINLTPMLDIVFNLIIFFMVGTRFVDSEHKVDVKVPQVKSDQKLAAVPDKRIINVFRDGRIALDRQELTLEQLTAKLGSDRRSRPDMGVVIRGDAEGPFQNVANVLTACRDAGIADMGISVRLQPTKQR